MHCGQLFFHFCFLTPVLLQSNHQLHTSDLDFWLNSTPFWCKFHYCSLKTLGVTICGKYWYRFTQMCRKNGYSIMALFIHLELTALLMSQFNYPARLHGIQYFVQALVCCLSPSLSQTWGLKGYPHVKPQHRVGHLKQNPDDCCIFRVASCGNRDIRN